MRPFWALYVAPFAFTGLLMTVPPACTSAGKLDPRVAPVVSTVHEAACTFVPLGGAEVCEATKVILRSVLGALSAPLGGVRELREYAVTYRGKTIARRLTQREAEQLTKELGEVAFAAKIERALENGGTQ
jgi:hypothetical protein